MAEPTVTPGTVSATLTKGLLDSYNAFMADKAQAYDAYTSAITNQSPHSAVSAQSIGEILQEATFLPASQSRFRPGRGGVQPSYVLLARVGPKGADAAAGSIISALTEFSNAGVSQGVPHVVIGYTGEVVQMVDLRDTATFLFGKSYPSPTPLSPAGYEDQLIDAIVSFTAAHESGSAGFAAFNPNDAGHGISYGFIQFNQKGGSLSVLLKLMAQRNAKEFDSIFGSALAAQLLNEPLVRSLELNLARYKDQFQRAALVPEFQQAQISVARSIYWNQAKNAALRMGLTSQRAYAILFDTAVQRTVDFLPRAAAALQGPDSELAKLAKLSLWADTLKSDLKTSLGTTYYRRRNLLSDTRLSDEPLMQAPPVDVATARVSDETSVSIMLEGRVGDPLTKTQLDTLALVLRRVCDSQGIPPASTRVLGLDRLSGLETLGNPGPEFDYFGLYNTLGHMPKLSPEKWYRSGEALNSVSIAAAAKKVLESLQKARAEDSLKSLVVADAYEDLRSAARTKNYVQNTRKSYSAGQVALNTVNKTADAVKSAAYQKAVADAEKIQGQSAESVEGLLYNFDTGLWSDGVAVGRFSQVVNGDRGDGEGNA